MSKDCHSPAEFNRYHAELSYFLEERDTVRALCREAVTAIFQLKRTLRAKEHKLARYVRHGMKNHMHAMTTSPTKGQNVHLRHGPDQMGHKYQTHKTLRRMLNRIESNFRHRKHRASAELFKNARFSSTWTRDYLIKKEQALIDRNHAKRQHVKSARLSLTDFIAWNFDIGYWLDLPDPLYHVIPHFSRVCKITSVSEPSGGKFAKCTCGEREGVGVPCHGVFKICDDASVPDQDMVHPPPMHG